MEIKQYLVIAVIAIVAVTAFGYVRGMFAKPTATSS